MEEWLHESGAYFIYLVVSIASLTEGAAVIVTASALAYKYDQISLTALIAITLMVSLCTNQMLFFIGRKYGPQLIESRPRLKEASEKVFYHLHKHSTLFILSFRFILGIRKPSPIIIGAAGVSIKRFSILNSIGAVIWSVFYCSVGYMIGYYFADNIEDAITSLGAYQRNIFIVIAILAGFIGLIIYFKKRVKN